MSIDFRAFVCIVEGASIDGGADITCRPCLSFPGTKSFKSTLFCHCGSCLHDKDDCDLSALILLPLSVSVGSVE